MNNKKKNEKVNNKPKPKVVPNAFGEVEIDPRLIKTKDPKLAKESKTEVIYKMKGEEIFYFNKDNGQYRFLINPNGLFKEIWDILHAIFVMYIAFLMSFKISFLASEDYPLWAYFDFAVDIFFGLDILLTFFTPYLSKNYTYVVSHKRIALNYIFSFWFIVDVISVIPLNLILGDNSSDIFIYARLVRAPRLYKVIRMMKLLRTLRKKSKGFTGKVILFFKKTTENVLFKNVPFFLLIFSMAHIFACIWHYFNATGLDNWIVSEGYDDESTFDKYFAVLYFIYTTFTTVGYGDLTPVTIVERFMALFFMSLGVLIFAYIFDKMSTELQELSEKLEYVNSKIHELKVLKNFIRLEKAQINHMIRIVQYVPKASINTVPLISEEDIKGFDKVLTEVFTSHFGNHILLKDFTPEMKIKFIRAKEEVEFPQETVIYHENSPADKAYFIKSGKVKLCFKIDLEGDVEYIEFVTLTKGHFFGVCECVVNPRSLQRIKTNYRKNEFEYKDSHRYSNHYYYTAICESSVECYEIDREHLQEIIERSHKQKENAIKILKHRAHCLEYWRNKLVLFTEELIQEIEDEMDLKRSDTIQRRATFKELKNLENNYENQNKINLNIMKAESYENDFNNNYMEKNSNLYNKNNLNSYKRGDDDNKKNLLQKLSTKQNIGSPRKRSRRDRIKLRQRGITSNLSIFKSLKQTNNIILEEPENSLLEKNDNDDSNNNNLDQDNNNNGGSYNYDLLSANKTRGPSPKHNLLDYAHSANLSPGLISNNGNEGELNKNMNRKERRKKRKERLRMKYKTINIL